MDSAGLGSWHVGNQPDPRAQEIARAMGSDISHLRARQVSPDDFNRFTHVVALDRSNLRELETLRPKGSSAHISLLLDFVPGREGQEVADPYYGHADGFSKTWTDVMAGAEGIVVALKRAQS